MSFDVPATPVEIVKVGHSALGNGTRSVTEDVGDPMLAQHLHSLMMFQRLAIANGYGWQRFLHMVDQVLPRRGDTLLLPFNDPNLDKEATTNGPEAQNEGQDIRKER